MTREYKLEIESANDDFEGLSLECRHATKTLKALKKRDTQLARVGQGLKAPMRVWLKDKISDWQGKVDQLNFMLVHWRAEKEAKRKRERYLEVKRIWEAKQHTQGLQ